MTTLVARPLTPEAYAPYGRVVMASPRGEEGRLVNQGRARRFDHLVTLENGRDARAALNVAVFRCAPWRRFPLAVEVLEKHPASTQLFLPMNAARYLVIVAQGGDRPELATLAAFVAPGTQGVSYHPGIWHHPMIALESETDFTCLVWEDGSSADCAVVTYAGDERRQVVLPPLAP